MKGVPSRLMNFSLLPNEVLTKWWGGTGDEVEATAVFGPGRFIYGRMIGGQRFDAMLKGLCAIQLDFAAGGGEMEIGIRKHHRYKGWGSRFSLGAGRRRLPLGARGSWRPWR